MNKKVIILLFVFCLSGCILYASQNNTIDTDKNAHIKMQYVLMLEFNTPVADNIYIFETETKMTVFCGKYTLSGKVINYSYIMPTEDELYRIFNLKIRTSFTKGAGNSSDADAYYTSIIDKSALNKNIRPLLKDFYINNDPKFFAADESYGVKCREIRK